MQTYATNNSFGPIIGSSNAINSGMIINLTGKPLSVALAENGIEIKHVAGGIDGFIPLLVVLFKERLYYVKKKIELYAIKKLEDRHNEREGDKEEIIEEASQFEQKFSDEQIQEIIKKLPISILKNPTYPAIISEMEKDFPNFSKRQA